MVNSAHLLQMKSQSLTNAQQKLVSQSCKRNCKQETNKKRALVAETELQMQARNWRCGKGSSQ